MENKEYLEFAKEIAYEAGRIMLKYFKQNNGASYKGDKTIVTLADKEINTYLFGEDQRYDTDIKGAVISNGIIHNEVIETIRNLV